MTLEERAANIASKLSSDTADHYWIMPIIRRALIEQDKITRHAGAEDITKCPGEDNQDHISGKIKRTAAYAAVMNCRGGVE